MGHKTVSNNAEVVEALGFRLPFTFDLGYLGGPRTVSEPCKKGVQFIMGTLRNALDIAVVAVAYPTRKAECFGFVLSGGAKADALNAAADKAMELGH